MCTVTFLPLENQNFILTSNRDEQRLRETVSPKKYEENGVKMVFPKDKVAGGTWIGISSKNRLVCVLNGAFVKHQRKENYRKSRGVIAKELLQEEVALNYIENLNLEGVEPFTMVIVDWNNNLLNLFELVWDEKQKHVNQFKNEPKIWSSTSLYSPEIKKLRKDWFQNWRASNQFTSENILSFHHSEIGDKEQAVLMKRSYVETVSITSIKRKNGKIEFTYEDIINREKSTKIILSENN